MSTSLDTLVAQREPRVVRQRIVVRAAVASNPTDCLGVVHLTSEYWPLARTGGLGEAVSGLAGFQAQSKLPTTVVMPLHRAVRDFGSRVEAVGAPFTLQVGPRTEVARLFQLAESGPGPRVFFVDHEHYFDRTGIYGSDGSDYRDNARRFALFAHAALAVLPAIAPRAQILHVHDWHTALAPAYLRTVFSGQPYYDRLAAVLSIHNAGYHGDFEAHTLADVGLASDVCDSRAFDWYGRTNLLKGGIAFSEAVVTVSPAHASELRTADGGFGLHETFVALGHRLTGILNGIDVNVWNPETDSAIVARYSSSNLGGKRGCKAALQRAFGLLEDDVPLFAMSSRLTTQKGLDLILGGGLLTNPRNQFVFLGCGEARYEEALKDLARGAPDRIGVQLEFTDRREHELMSGADFLLMPSLYEPCGLAQMRAQVYGTVPVARRVGGLADTIDDGITGFLFDAYSPEALERVVERALKVYNQADAWQRVVRAAMSRAFGWRRSTERYTQTYRSALALRGVRQRTGTGALNSEAVL